MASFLCASLFQSVCVRVDDDVVLVATLFFFGMFTSYRMHLLGAFSCRPSVSPEPPAARMPLSILWLSSTGYCCRERQNSLFVLEYASSRVWFLYQCSKLVGLRHILGYFLYFSCGSHYTRYFCIFHAHSFDTYVLVIRCMKKNKGAVCGVVSCTAFSYWGAC